MKSPIELPFLGNMVLSLKARWLKTHDIQCTIVVEQYNKNSFHEKSKHVNIKSIQLNLNLTYRRN